MKRHTDVSHAVELVARRFPFPGYIENAPESHAEVAESVLEMAPRGSAILDFAAGPCDKTAVLATLGYACTAYDDLNDPWHREADNRATILEFARQEGIRYVTGPDEPLPEGPFDIVMAHDVIEHLHDSPRDLLLRLVDALRPGGYLFITVPNAANLRKRIALARGRTNLPDFATYYWSDPPWRGHVREYVRRDLSDLVEYLGLELVRLGATHHNTRRLPTVVRVPYLAVTWLLPDLRDTWTLIAKRPTAWQRPGEPDEALRFHLRKVSSPYYARAAL